MRTNMDTNMGTKKHRALQRRQRTRDALSD